MFRTLLLAALATSAWAAQADVLTYSGTLIDDGIHGAALFDGMPLGPATAFSFTAEFDPAQRITALPIGTATPLPLPPGWGAFAASTVRFTVAGLGSFDVLPGSYAVTLQDPSGPGLFGRFAGTYAVGLAERSYPGPGAMLAGFGQATPGFTAAQPVATTLSGDQGAIAEMYVRFQGGHELDFYLPAPVAGVATAAVVPEPSVAALTLLGLVTVFMRVRQKRQCEATHR